MNAINNFIQNELDKILKLQLLKRKELHDVYIKNSKSIGRLHFELLPAEKAAMLQHIHRKYDKQIQTIYENINSKLSDLNMEKIQNPF